MPVHATWTKEDRPLGCNGHYGNSGSNRHWRNGTPACKACKDSAAHFRWVQRTEARAVAKGADAVKEKAGRREVLVYGCNRRWGASGYAGHIRRGETPCLQCRDSYNQYRRMRRNFTPKPCGTMAAIGRHRRARQPLCSKCKKRDAQNKRRQRQAKGITK